MRVHGERPLPDAVSEFDREVGAFFERGGEVPFGLLGLGTDGHTASLFTESHLKESEGRWAIGVSRPDGLNGVSLTPQALARVARVVFLVAGTDKRAVLQQLIRAPNSVTAGRAVAGCPRVEIWCDAAANPL